MLQGNHQRKHHLYGRGKPLQAIPSGIATRSLGEIRDDFQGILSFDLGKTPRNIVFESLKQSMHYILFVNMHDKLRFQRKQNIIQSLIPKLNI